MAQQKLDRNGEFTVGDDRLLVYILSILFFALFGYGLIDAISKHFRDASAIFMVALVPALYCLRKARRNRIYIRVNKKGIYQDEKLLTPWANLLKAYITQEQKLASIQDNFVLIVEFWKNDPTQGHRRKIPLTNTQNKSEEEVLVAINFFWRHYKREHGLY